MLRGTRCLEKEHVRLSGCWAALRAKDAVRQWAAQRYGLHLAPADVEILADTRWCAALASISGMPESR